MVAKMGTGEICMKWLITNVLTKFAWYRRFIILVENMLALSRHGRMDIYILQTHTKNLENRIQEMESLLSKDVDLNMNKRDATEVIISGMLHGKPYVKIHRIQHDDLFELLKHVKYLSGNLRRVDVIPYLEHTIKNLYDKI